MTADKPPYQVPTMAEVAVVPSNGLRLASLFAGAGGSCLGYRMAGFEVAWANEFEPNAGDSYHANFPACALDRGDIRQVRPEDVLGTMGLGVGELDLLDGSPPCQSFSTAGQRQRSWGRDVAHADGTTQRSDDLFFEYARLVKGIQPRVFVAENVSGLVKGVAKGYFKEILKALQDCGYVVEARLLDAQWLGVPQARRRLIFVGVRHDLGRLPVFPSPLPYRYNLAEALPWVRCARAATSHGPNSWDTGETLLVGRPAPTVPTGASAAAYNEHQVFGDAPPGIDEVDSAVLPVSEKVRAKWGGEQPMGQPRKLTILELKRLCSFPDDYRLVGGYAQRWARLGNSVPPLMMRAVAVAVRDGILS